MLIELPQLKVLQCNGNRYMTGNLNSLRVLKDTLEKLCIYDCRNVGGNIMDLSDFPQLKGLRLYKTPVTGDIRDINVIDFPALKWLELPRTVKGGLHYEFQSIAEVPNFMHAIHRLQQRTSRLFDGWEDAFGWSLSRDSPGWYESVDGILNPPLSLECVQAGSRFGWKWFADDSTQDHNRARSTGWIQSQSKEATTMMFTLRCCKSIVCSIFSEDIIFLLPMLRSSAVCVKITECEVSNIVVCKAHDMVEDLEGPERFGWYICQCHLTI